jgi:hypothetical protein
MLRPTAAKAVATAATALVLLTACGTDDKGSLSEGGETPAGTPSASGVASFDPPKAFVTTSAFGVEATKSDTRFTFAAGMVGQTTLISGLEGISGRNIAAQGQAWFYPATELDTTETLDLSKPLGVQLDGKDVVAIAYVQSDKGNGTQKAKAQVVFQWIDAAEGKKVAEVIADLTPVVGPGGDVDAVVSQAYDPATGQIAVGVSPYDGTSSGHVTTAYADPKTQKASVIPALAPAGLLNGVIAGAAAGDTRSGAIVIADGATGKITKQTPYEKDYLSPAGSGVKHAYLSGSEYGTPDPQTGMANYNNTLYSVDIATGTIVPIKSSYTSSSMSYTCLGDRANAVVCTGNPKAENVEILGLDDSTGKKTWGYTEKSANRIVPDVTAAFHGIVYAQAEAQPVLMDAATGEDVKASTEGATPTVGSGSPGADPASANGSDMSLFNGEMRSPVAVTQYGGTYLQEKLGSGFYTNLIALTPIA